MLTKNVNGRKIELSAEEEAIIRAEWAASEAAPVPPEPRSIEDKISNLIDQLEDAGAISAVNRISDLPKRRV